MHLAAMNPASYIDHTVLRQDTTTADIQKLCEEAQTYSFAAVCVPPVYVREASGLLAESPVKVATVIGFPFGYHLPMVKATESELAIMSGAAELDMVANISAIKSNEWRAVETEVREVLEVVKLRSAKLKVIIESGILTDEELRRCCDLYSRFNIDFLKTSTGFAAKGASVEAVRTMRQLLPEHIAIKASGGIRTWAFAKELIDAGATRIGCSASVQIMQEAAEA
jgi:deoxyribose-phosphate aldolase